MLTPKQVEQVLETVNRLDRGQIVEQMRRCPARFPIDFSDDWLQTQPIEELRHVFAAVCIQCELMPQDGHPRRSGRAA